MREPRKPVPKRIHPAREYTLSASARLARGHISELLRAVLDGRLPARRDRGVYYILGSDLSTYLARQTKDAPITPSKRVGFDDPA